MSKYRASVIVFKKVLLLFKYRKLIYSQRLNQLVVMYYVLLLLLSFSSLFSLDHVKLSKEPACIVAESAPNSFVNGTVNAIGGNFYFAMKHLHVPGHIPMDLIQYYNNQSSYSYWLGTGMGLNYSFWIQGQVFSHKDHDTHNKYSEVHVEAPGGSILIGLSKFDDKGMTYYLDPDIIYKGLANTASGKICARTNLKNLSIKTKNRGPGRYDWTVHLPDGTTKEYFRTYDHFENSMNLRTEHRLNGSKLTYSYYKYHEEEGRPRKITASAKHVWNELYFEKAKISASNGQKASFSYFRKDGSDYIDKIETTDNPEITFEYGHAGKLYCINKIKWPDDRFLEIEYDHKARVKCQKGPVGPDGEKRTIYSFSYDDDHTKVTDANDHVRIYRHSHKRLTSLQEFKKHKLFRSHDYVWGENEGLSWGKYPKTNAGNLCTEAICNGDKKAEYAKRFSYDDYGNVLKETIYGNLSGYGKKAFALSSDGIPYDSHIEHYHKYYTYAKNLLTHASEDDGPSYEYRYIPGTDLLSAKYTKNGKKILLREFYTYDDDGILVKKIVDDGSTTLTTIIKPVSHNHAGRGLPHEIIECYGDKPKQIKRTIYNYNEAGKVIEEAIFDANNEYRYSNYFDYDEKNRLRKKTNALKEITRYEYDANNNKIFEELQGSRFYTKFTYDRANRLIASVECHDDGTYIGTKYSYDLMGNKLSSTDRYGRITHFQYDSLNRLKAITYPDKTTLTKKYDIFDNVIEEIDQNGHTTRFEYTAQKQPTRIAYPDGAVERFEYNLNGTLKAKWDASNTKTSYTYDILGRPTEISIYDEAGNKLSSTAHTYDSFHLLSTTDPMGVTTYFSYDGAGRKIQECKQDSKTTFEYDSLGRLSCTKSFCPNEYIADYSEYDYLDRIILQKRLDVTGKVISWSYYEYDICGNQTLKRSGNEIEVNSIYNSQSELIERIDECGHSTKYFFDHSLKLQRKLTTDALENITEEHFDVLGRVTVVLKRNKFQKLLAQTNFYYSPLGKKTKQLEHVFVDGKIDHEYVIEWEYDARDRIKKVIEQSDKITNYEYDLSGRIKQITKPDGTSVFHTYDALGRLSTLSSSDKTISYHYTYDLNNNPIEIYDEVSGYSTTRSYDAWNRVTKDGPLTFTYDALGRITSLVAPNLAIKYTYLHAHLNSVQRYSAANELLYEHLYKAFDLHDHVLESELINGLGTATFTWDKKGRNTKISTDYFSQEIPQDGFDAVGNLKLYSIANETIHASYDDLYQLTEENGCQYEHDSIHNRLAKNGSRYNLDSLNKISFDKSSSFIYDKNGNIIEKRDANKVTHYFYDALDRLIKVDDTSYAYDGLNRRISRTLANKTEYFLYFGLREIGSEVDGELQQLRVLGLGKGAELGASVATELKGKLFAPIHDFRGNVVALVDPSTKQIAESYRYTAFGECETFSSLPLNNPWRFASKRYDQETGFVYFSKRYYDPKLGRWITPDPLGFADGPNLYAYVHNSPLTNFDLYGLFAFEDEYDPIESMQMYGMVEASIRTVIDYVSLVGFMFGGSERYEQWSQWANASLNNYKSAYIEQAASLPGNTATFEDLQNAAGGGNFTRDALDISKIALNLAKLSVRAGKSIFKISSCEKAALETSKSVSNNKQLIVSNQSSGIATSKAKPFEKSFPENPKDLLPELPRDAKGRIYTADNLRIRPEQHALKPGESYSPRHHGQHYHVETRYDTSKSWDKKGNIFKIRPDDYQHGNGTGFLPGEKFPGL